MSSEYIAGACNIGKGEIRRRQFVALIGIFLTVSTATTLLATDQARSARFSIFLPAMIFSVGFIQSRKKFCLAYGLAGTFNFGKLGSITKVQSAEDRKADRKTAVSILAQASFLAVAIAAVFFAFAATTCRRELRRARHAIINFAKRQGFEKKIEKKKTQKDQFWFAQSNRQF